MGFLDTNGTTQLCGLIKTDLADKQDKALSSSVTIGGETVGTVEDAIEEVADIVPSDASSSNQLATQADLQNVEIDVDNALSSSSENPVQNKVIKGALDNKQDLIFEGTTAQWNAVTDKSKYSMVVLTDDADYVGNIVDSVTDGNMSAVTSNAVYDALLGKLDSSRIRYGISSTAVDTTGSITFDTAFADTNYVVFICPINANADIAWSSSVISKTASGFVFETKYQTTNSTTWISYYRGIGWLAVHL